MIPDLFQNLIAGDIKSLARLISLVESESPETLDIIKAVYPLIGRAHVVGITGPPGAGKSCLVDSLTVLIRKPGRTVGIVAVDPTSPFSGGALLGDRIRMQQHSLDEGVFVRSMATRGAPGGLSRAARNVIRLLDVSGRDIILIETAGVGQTELEIMEAADTIVVTLVPEAAHKTQYHAKGIRRTGEKTEASAQK